MNELKTPFLTIMAIVLLVCFLGVSLLVKFDKDDRRR